MVRGPASVQVRGACSVLGMDVSGLQVRVRTGKVLPFEPAQGCELGIKGGEWWEASPSAAGTSMWEWVAQRIIARCMHASSRPAAAVIVMVVGATDTGKSTFCTYLANSALRANITPCVIDGDIGQGDLAPPSALGAAVLRGPATDLRDVNAGFFEFVGDISPSSAATKRLVAGKMRALLGRTRRLARLQIINTDGYVAGDGGAAYKRMLVLALRPDIVVSLGRRGGGRGRGRGTPPSLYGPWLLLRARQGGHPAAAKTRSERVGRRLDQYTQHVGQGSVTVDTRAVRFARPGRAGSLVLPAKEVEEGTFVALAAASGMVVTGFGIIESIDESGMAVTIRTALPAQSFDTVYLGSVRLLEGAEVRINETQDL